MDGPTFEYRFVWYTSLVTWSTVEREINKNGEEGFEVIEHGRDPDGDTWFLMERAEMPSPAEAT
jgi:hypothetical protein